MRTSQQSTQDISEPIPVQCFLCDDSKTYVIERDIKHTCVTPHRVANTPPPAHGCHAVAAVRVPMSELPIHGADCSVLGPSQTPRRAAPLRESFPEQRDDVILPVHGGAVVECRWVRRVAGNVPRRSGTVKQRDVPVRTEGSRQRRSPRTNRPRRASGW